MKMSLADNVLLMINMSPIASVVTDPRLPDNPIIACNQAFIELTGYSRGDIIGRNCRFLSGKDTDVKATEAVVTAIVERRPVVVEILNYKKDGTPFQNAVMVTPVMDEKGRLRYFLGVQVDVTDRATIADNRRKVALKKLARLSVRQREVMSCLADGDLNKEIAFKLGITERTVKMHRAALLKQLGAEHNADAIRIAVEAGL